MATSPRDGSMGEWLRAYCDHLRSYAAGRGGDNQGALTTARVEEAQAKTAMMRLNYAERLGKLVPADDAARIVVDWAGHTNREIRAAVEKAAPGPGKRARNHDRPRDPDRCH